MFCASRGFWTEPQLVIWFWFWWVKVWSLHPPSATNTAAVLVVQTKAWKKHQAGRWMSFLLFSFVWFVVGGDTQFLCITSTISQVLQGCGYLPNPDLSVLVACDGWCHIFYFFALSRWHSLHNMPYSLMASQLNTLCHLHRCIHCLHYATRVTIQACRLTLTPFSHTTQKYITRAAGRDISHIKFKKQNKKSFRSTDLNFFTVKEKRWKICLRVKTELKTGTPLRSFSLQTSGTTCRSTCGVCV